MACVECLKDCSGSVRGREVCEKWILRRSAPVPVVLVFRRGLGVDLEGIWLDLSVES